MTQATFNTRIAAQSRLQEAERKFNRAYEAFIRCWISMEELVAAKDELTAAQAGV